MIFTIGHSTRPLAEFVALLKAHGIAQLADVRRVPKSARHPHFVKEALDSSLASEGILYRHFPELGGLRKPRPDSVNTGLRHESFRGYADYMQTEAFRTALLDLVQFSGVATIRLGGTPPRSWCPERARVSGESKGTTALMCAEAVWWRCHRKLLSDVLLVRGVQVRHILSTADPKVHELSEFAREDSGGVTYPGLL